jgi:hypothetical protein
LNLVCHRLFLVGKREASHLHATPVRTGSGEEIRPFDHRLGDDHSIERIAVMIRQMSDTQGVRR